MYLDINFELLYSFICLLSVFGTIIGEYLYGVGGGE